MAQSTFAVAGIFQAAETYQDKMSVLLLALVLLLCLFLVPLGLPGTWLMLGTAIVYDILVPSNPIGWVAIGAATAGAIVGEVFEFTVSARYTAKYGGSRRAGWGHPRWHRGGVHRRTRSGRRVGHRRVRRLVHRRSRCGVHAARSDGRVCDSSSNWRIVGPGRGHRAQIGSRGRDDRGADSRGDSLSLEIGDRG